ncbi:MAG: hypothetical protein OEU26_04965 [Candidatus Tectomicrobia bacterium]|nr:hypothetical protein [Candidatus Tectomicrobia bacterium]
MPEPTQRRDAVNLSRSKKAEYNETTQNVSQVACRVKTLRKVCSVW